MNVRYNLIVVGAGAFICVSDPSIVAAAFRTGAPPEAAASAFADQLKYAEEHPDTQQTAVILITGSGLKDTSILLSDSTRGQSRGQPHHVPTPLAEALT
jgi:threonine synthase